MRSIFTIILFLLGISSNAQVARWVLHPKYDSIKMLGTGYYVVTNNGKYGMVDSNEKEVVPLAYDSIAPFASHQALLFNNNKFMAYVSDQGKLNQANDYELTGTSVFVDGYLLVHNDEGYHFISAATGDPIGPYPDASPFSEGYARIKVQSAKGKDRICHYISAKTGKPITLPLEDNSADDIDFLSSSNNGKSIVIIKKRVYEYNFKENTLTPLSTDNTDSRKARVTTNERPIPLFTTDDGGYQIMLKQGIMTFDHLMRLTSIQYEEMDEQKFTIPQTTNEEPTSHLIGAKFEGTNLLGLKTEKQVILPAQFDKIPLLWGDEALVLKNGKYGIVKVEENGRKWRYELNDNENIGFEHKSVKTHIKALCPPSMNSSLLSLKSNDKNCIIKMETRKDVSNPETAMLDYECTLNVPKEIGESLSSSTISVSLNYDGLTFLPDKIEYKNWFINKYTVQLGKPQLSGGTMTVDVIVNNNSTEDQKYNKTVTIEASDSVIATISPITDETYSAKFVNWKDNRIHFEITVKEDGCPAKSYPFTLNTKEGTESKPTKTAQEGETPAEPKAKKVVKKPKVTPKKQEEIIITHF